METCHSNVHLSIYGMGYVPAFMMGDEMGDTPAFVIKGDTSAFMVRDGMGDMPAFVINGDTPLAMCVSFTCIIRDVQ
jgi:hypothetical protein